jgi:antitoxin VapB
MQINIKNPKACRLAYELCQVTGETLTQAVTSAIQTRLDQLYQTKRHHKQGMAERLLQIGEKLRNMPDIDSRNMNEILYDADGLPRDAAP